MNKLLLDTDTFIWYVNGDSTLNSNAKKNITQSLHGNNVFLAAISLWEISMLQVRQRIILEMPCLEWLNKAIELTRVQVVNLTPAIAAESCSLPGNFHEDPADRMIVATARVNNLLVVTRDKKMLEYSRSKYISTIQA